MPLHDSRLLLSGDGRSSSSVARQPPRVQAENYSRLSYREAHSHRTCTNKTYISFVPASKPSFVPLNFDNYASLLYHATKLRPIFVRLNNQIIHLLNTKCT